MPTVPKPPEQRQRRNKPASAAVLPNAFGVTKPPLPEKEGGWMQQTLAYWDDIWASPMSTRYLRPDVYGLLILMELVDQFFRTGDKELASEIRQQRVPYGLTPIDRNRLSWKVEPQTLTEPEPERPKSTFDPRKVLEMKRK
jgi:hypothetical protein